MKCELINKHFTLIHFVQIVAYKMWPLQFIIKHYKEISKNHSVHACTRNCYVCFWQ